MQLTDFIESVEDDDPGEVLRVQREVPIEYVITEMAFELERRREFPVLVFEDVEGFEMPVVSNLMGTRERIARAVDIDPDDFYDEWNRRAARTTPVNPVSSAPVKEAVTLGDEVDLPEQLPALKHFVGDAGRYVTASLIVAKHPETGVRNMAFARALLKGPRTMGVSAHSRGDLWEYLQVAEERNEPLEVLMIPGGHPSLYIGTSASPSIDVDEYELVGSVRDEALDVVPAETVDLDVPADADIVIEGTIDPMEHDDEGPFGEYTGFMSGRSTRNVFRATAVTTRADPTYVSIVPGKSAEHLLLGAAPKEPFIWDRIRQENPYVKDIALPLAGTYFHAFVSIDKTNEAQPKQTILSTLGAWRYLKLVVVVDEEIDVHDEREVLWAIATTVQADDDVLIVPDAVGNQLDPSSDDGITDKMGIDATKPEDGQYQLCEVPDEYAERAKDILNDVTQVDPIPADD